MTNTLISRAESVADLLGSFQLRAKGLIGPDQVQYFPERGFHIYGKLNLLLPLAASEDTTNSKRYLQIVQLYAEIASKCATISGASLLEVQGEVMHLLLPCDHTPEAVDRLLAFAIAFAQIVYDEVAPLAGDSWRSFVMAADHGRAILISNGNGSSDSVVSLGPAANHPAKQIPETRAGMLSIRPQTLQLVYSLVDQRKTWESFDLRNPPYQPQMRKYSTDQAFLAMAATMKVEAKQLAVLNRAFRAEVRILTSQQITPGFEPDVSSPLKLQGFYMRADLDGFTDDVQKAFEDPTGAAVQKIVRRFSGFMAFADEFAVMLKSQDRATIRLPWAGDCCNMILLTRPNRSYDAERPYVPVTEAAKWHDLTANHDSSGKKWREYLLESEWAVAIAGGSKSDDEDEGCNGYLLVATVVTDNRRFRIAAGWAMGRSRNALEVSGVEGRDTVVHRADYAALSAHYQHWFTALASGIFYKAHDLGMETIRAVSIDAEGQTGPTVVSAVNIHIPRERPHYIGST